MKPWVSCLLLAVLGLLPCLPGCHLLFRLGEQQPASEGTDDKSIEQGEKANAGPPPLESTNPPKKQDVPPPLQEQSKQEPPKRIIHNTGINTNTALAPGEGQFIYRTQLRFLQAHSNPGTSNVDLNLLVVPNIVAYGARENLALFAVVPAVIREGIVRPATPAGGFAKLDDQGIADISFFGKYRFWKKDLPGETYRWSTLAGIEVPSYDEPFSSDSWNPFVGTVWTYLSQEWGLDLDWVWKFNTGKGFFRHDEMVYDAAYTYVLLTGQTLDEKFWQVNSVFEFNGSYLTDGSHLVFASPGIQLALERMIVEASFQIPVIRDLKNVVEPDSIFVVGTRITW